jgi:phosphoglycolate phosphatase-like HAD superfamily hydrolase
MEKKTAFAFDFDGTLTLSFSMEDDCMAKACQAVGFKDVTPAIIHQNYGPTEDGIIRKLVGEANFRKAWAFFLDYYAKESKKLKPFKGIPELLKTLSQKKCLVILLTGRSRESLEISLADLGLSSCFIRAYTGSPYGTNKEKSMTSLLTDYGLAKKDVLYIGDTLEDIQMMRSIDTDILSAGYSHDSSYQQQLEKANPGNVCHSVDDLKKRLVELIR